MNKGAIKYILFDLDGTLTDPKPGITRCIQYSLGKLDKPVPPVEELLWCIGPPLLDSFKKLLAPETGMAEKALSLYRVRFNREGKFENNVYPGIPELLQELTNSGFILYTATSKPYIFAREILTHFNLSRFFKNVYGSELDGTRNSKCDLIAHLLEFENIPPHQTVMVGDRCYDVAGAKHCNILTLGVTYGYGSRAELEAAGAEAISDSPKNIQTAIEAFS